MKKDYMIEKFKELSRKYYPAVREHREYLHSRPELSFQEYETSSYIQMVLDQIGIDYKKGIGVETGVVAEVGNKDRIVAVRGDMDALPIIEEGDHAYISQNEGVMHACGHDVHTSCLLGVAYILKDLEEELGSRVRFIFQPGEEKLPGGASKMIEDGVLDGVQAIIGQHVHPDLNVGHMGYASGYSMASADEIYIRVQGKGGHAAIPENCIDPIRAGAKLLEAMHERIDALKKEHQIPTVLNIGKFNTDGGATNVIPDRIRMEGTFRTYDEKWRFRAHQILQEIASEISAQTKTDIQLDIMVGYPCLFNDPHVTLSVKEAMENFLGRERVIEIPPRMTAEDFAYYSHEIPACFFRLGTSNADGKFSSPVHTPTFDIDPKALEIGSGFMAYMAYTLSHAS